MTCTCVYSWCQIFRLEFESEFKEPLALKIIIIINDFGESIEAEIFDGNPTKKRWCCFRESRRWIMHGALSVARRNRNELYRRIVNREEENRRPFSSYGRAVDRPSCGSLPPYARDMCGAQCMRETQMSRNRFSKLVPELP